MTLWPLVFLFILSTMDCRLLCGIELITSNFMELVVKLDCMDYLEQHEQCCIDHGTCYVKGKKVEKCDRRYCKCVKKIAKKGGLCQIHGDNFCNLITAFGKHFYDAYQ